MNETMVSAIRFALDIALKATLLFSFTAVVIGLVMWAADHLAAVLGVLVLTNTAQLWHVYLLALLLGIVSGTYSSIFNASPLLNKATSAEYRIDYLRAWFYLTLVPNHRQVVNLGHCCSVKLSASFFDMDSTNSISK